MPKKIVVAYSGGFDTSVILKWFQLNFDCTDTSDIGQNDNIDQIKLKTKKLDVKNICINGLKEQFIKSQFAKLTK